MTTAMLAAIAADLDDDTRRLAYADWLDEHDEHDRAELIRVQCEIVNLPECEWLHCGEWNEKCKSCPPRRRERELIAAHPEWTQWEKRTSGGHGWSGLKHSENILSRRTITWDRGWPGWVHVERVSELVHLGVRDGATHTKDTPTPLLIALAQTPPWGVPLRGVIVEELRPFPSVQHPGWCRFYTDERFPQVVYDLLKGEYPGVGAIQPYWRTEQSAIRAAAAAFLEFGRKHK